MSRVNTIENEADHHIRQCLLLIEKQLGWGDSANWTSYDFSKLSDEVHQRTHVRLSVTTLKRIWGKVKYDSAPTITTLNALSQFAGYEDWRDFTRRDSVVQANNVSSTNNGVREPNPYETRSQLSRYWLLAGVPVVALGFLLMFSAGKIRSAKLEPDDFQFSANKVVTEGVPNSVVFHYDATKAPNDSVYIVQTWDLRRKKLVSKQNHEHSAIYYYPGYFNTKLIVDGQIIKTHDLFVTSGGWLCLADQGQDQVPLYFKKEETVFDDRVEVDAALLARYNLSLNPNPPRVRFFNQGDLGDIMNDNFVFQTTLKNGFNEGTGACQFVEVLIQCKDDIIIIPLSAKTCIGQLHLYVCGKDVRSDEADLSKFGQDLSQWTTLRLESVNKNVTLSVNGEKAYTLTFPNESTGVVGVQYRFPGVGAVKDTWFECNGNRIDLGN